MDMRLSVLSIVLALPGAHAWACSCAVNPAGNRPCQAAWESAAVFSGTVIDITGPMVVPLAPLQEGGRALARPTTNDPPRPPAFPKLQVRLRVNEVVNGLSAGGQEVSILTGRGGGDCGYPFRRGVDYMVYAYRNAQGQLETGICSRTRPLTEAAEDVAYLRALPQAAPAADLHIVTGLFNRPGTPGVKIRVSGDGTEYTAVTGGEGEARFAAMPPGEYQISGELEGYFPVERTVKLHAKGCADVMVGMALDRRVTGRILTTEGQPAAGVEVQVRRPQEHSGDRVTTDAEGRYEFRHFGAGVYYLGINLSNKPSFDSPYPTWFYPGTTDRRQAAQIVFSEKPQIQHYDFTLPDRQHERMVEGTVFWPDGRPAAAAGVVVLDPAWLWQGAAAQTTADAQGRFTLRVLDGTAYRLHATARNGTSGMVSAEPVEIQPAASPLNLRLVLTRTGNSVADDQRKGMEQFRNPQ